MFKNQLWQNSKFFVENAKKKKKKGQTPPRPSPLPLNDFNKYGVIIACHKMCTIVSVHVVMLIKNFFSFYVNLK